MNRQIFTFLLALSACSAFGQKLKTVEAEYTYHAPENMSLEEARRTALERAKIQALATAFGTIITQTNTTDIQNHGGKSDIDFFSIGSSEVKGEWIETVGEPQYDISFDNGMIVLKVHVKGKAREIVSARIDLRAKMLRNGTDDKFESDEFRDGDDLYLSFVSPVSGYLAVYLMDAERQVYCLLPYRGQPDGIYRINANRRYLFFNVQEASREERAQVDEYTMTCSRPYEHNRIYLIFSPQPFAKAADNAIAETLPRQLDSEAFQQWLAKCRRHDKNMQTILKPLTITKRK